MQYQSSSPQEIPSCYDSKKPARSTGQAGEHHDQHHRIIDSPCVSNAHLQLLTNSFLSQLRTTEIISMGKMIYEKRACSELNTTLMSFLLSLLQELALLFRSTQQDTQPAPEKPWGMQCCCSHKSAVFSKAPHLEHRPKEEATVLAGALHSSLPCSETRASILPHQPQPLPWIGVSTNHHT